MMDNGNDCFLFLQRIVLQGRWDDCETFLRALTETDETLSKQVQFVIGKQRLLETLSWQGGASDRWAFPPWRPETGSAGGVNETADQTEVTRQLQELKSLCSVAQFGSLCMFLTLERLEDHPDFAQWSVAEGRWKVFSVLTTLLSAYLPTSGKIFSLLIHLSLIN